MMLREDKELLNVQEEKSECCPKDDWDVEERCKCSIDLVEQLDLQSC